MKRTFALSLGVISFLLWSVGSWRLLAALASPHPNASWTWELIAPTLGALGATAALLESSPSRCRLGALLVLALGWRVAVIVFGNPVALSDDINRYRFEGHVILEGHSPYRHAPDSPIHDDMVARKGLEELRAGVNHPRIATIYPAFAELSFATAAALEKVLGRGPLAWQLLILGFEALLVRWLLIWLDLRRQRAEWIALYLLLPLPWMEGVLSGHVDVAALAFLVGAAAAAKAGKVRWVWGLIAASILFKVLALFVAPLFLTRRSLLPAALAAAGTLAFTLLVWSFPEFPGTDFHRRGVLARADNGVTARSSDTDLKFQGPGWPPETREVAAWDDLLGRYRFVASTKPGEPEAFELEFDGQGRVFRPHDFLPFRWVPDGWYQQDSTGAYRVHQNDSTRPVFDVRISEDRSILVPIGDAPVGLKESEDPLMGWRQYAGRWTAHAPLFRILEDSSDFNTQRKNRRTLQRGLLLAVIAFSFLALFFGWSRAWCLGTALALLILGSPVIYPWYLLWLAPFAITGPRAGLAALTILAPALHGMVDPAAGIAPGEWFFWSAVLAITLMGCLLARRRRTREPAENSPTESKRL